MLSFLKRAFSGRNSVKAKPKPRKMLLEALEDRTCPTAVYDWIGFVPGVNENYQPAPFENFPDNTWENPNNWYIQGTTNHPTASPSTTNLVEANFNDLAGNDGKTCLMDSTTDAATQVDASQSDVNFVLAAYGTTNATLTIGNNSTGTSNFGPGCTITTSSTTSTSYLKLNGGTVNVDCVSASDGFNGFGGHFAFDGRNPYKGSGALATCVYNGCTLNLTPDSANGYSNIDEASFYVGYSDDTGASSSQSYGTLNIGSEGVTDLQQFDGKFLNVCQANSSNPASTLNLTSNVTFTSNDAVTIYGKMNFAPSLALTIQGNSNSLTVSSGTVGAYTPPGTTFDNQVNYGITGRLVLTGNSVIEFGTPTAPVYANLTISNNSPGSALTFNNLTVDSTVYTPTFYDFTNLTISTAGGLPNTDMIICAGNYPYTNLAAGYKVQSYIACPGVDNVPQGNPLAIILSQSAVLNANTFNYSAGNIVYNGLSATSAFVTDANGNQQYICIVAPSAPGGGGAGNG